MYNVLASFPCLISYLGRFLGISHLSLLFTSSLRYRHRKFLSERATTSLADRTSTICCLTSETILGLGRACLSKARRGWSGCFLACPVAAGRCYHTPHKHDIAWYKTSRRPHPIATATAGLRGPARGTRYRAFNTHTGGINNTSDSPPSQ